MTKCQTDRMTYQALIRPISLLRLHLNKDLCDQSVRSISKLLQEVQIFSFSPDMRVDQGHLLQSAANQFGLSPFKCTIAIMTLFVALETRACF